jgi:hypothetical protein
VRGWAGKAKWGCERGSRVLQTNIFAEGVKQTPIFRFTLAHITSTFDFRYATLPGALHVSA